MNTLDRQTNGSVIDFTDEMKTAYSYTRFSTLEQKAGQSGRRQLEASERWCKEHGYTLSPDHFTDEGKSAFKGKHLEGEGDLKRFLSLVECGKIRPGSVLILESFDRFSRLPMVKAVSLFLNVINSNIGMVFTMTHGQHLITEKTLNAEPYLIYSIIGEANRAHSESAHKSERVADACNKRKHNAKENGHTTLAWCPPWCDFDKQHGYVVNVGRAAILQRIYDEYLNGNGPFRISRIFNAEKVPVLGHRGFKEYKNTSAVWYKKNVRDFLTDRRVYGYCHFIDKENYFPVVISKDKFLAVQNRLALRSAAEPTGGPVERMGNLFTTICRCAKCDSVMSKSTTNKTYKGKTTHYEYLVCDGARSGNGCSWKSISYGEFERNLLNVIQTSTFKNMITGHNPNKGIEDKLTVMEGEQVTNAKQIEKLKNTFLQLDKPPVTLLKALNDFEARQIELSKGIQLTTAQLNAGQTVPGDAIAVFKMTDELIKTKEGRLKLRECIHATIKRITVDVETNITKIQFKSGRAFWVVLSPDGLTVCLGEEKAKLMAARIHDKKG